MSAESGVVRSYIDWILNLPWKKVSKINHDLLLAKNILDEDHYGLKKVKKEFRIFSCSKEIKIFERPNIVFSWSTWSWKNFIRKIYR